MVPRILDLDDARDAKEWAQRQWQRGKLAPAPQKPCDHGLFSDESAQLDCDDDLNRMIERSRAAKTHLRIGMSTIWDHNSPQQRAEYLQQLSNVPEIRAGLIRLNEARQKSRATQPPSLPPNQNGGS